MSGVLLLMPGSELPDNHTIFPGFDKVVHVFLFAIMTFLLAQAFKKQYEIKYIRYNNVILSFVICFVYGFVLEVLQFLLFWGRYFEWEDLLANFTGCITGVLIYKIVFFRV